MKKLYLFALVGLVGLIFVGCTTFNHSEYIDADNYGATGKYEYTSQGTIGIFGLAGAGGGAGGGVGGGGAGVIFFSSDFREPDPRLFAKSITMVDLSKKLKKVKIDEAGNYREYEYVQPLAEAKPESTSSPSPTFGREPIK